MHECDIQELLSFVSFDGPIKRRNLREIIETQLRTEFDSHLPAWRAVLATSTQSCEQESYLVFALHHALADGVRAVSLAEALMHQTEPNQHSSSPINATREDLPAALVDMASEFGARVFAQSLSLISQVMVDPRSARNRLTDLAASTFRSVNPFARPLSTLLAPRSGRLRVNWLKSPLPPLKQTATRNSVSLTAVMLNALRIGMAEYHASMGDTTSSLRVNVPVALDRQDGQRNALAVARIQLALHSTGDVRLDLKQLNTQLASLRTEPALQWANVAADFSRLLPAETALPLLGSLVGGADITVSSIKGPVLGHIGSHRVLGLTPFAPVFGAAVSLNLMTQDELLLVGICCDAGAVKHPKRLKRFCERGFAEMAMATT
jgi:hypothetical protein